MQEKVREKEKKLVEIMKINPVYPVLMAVQNKHTAIGTSIGIFAGIQVANLYNWNVPAAYNIHVTEAAAMQ